MLKEKTLKGLLYINFLLLPLPLQINGHTDVDIEKKIFLSNNFLLLSQPLQITDTEMLKYKTLKDFFPTATLIVFVPFIGACLLQFVTLTSLKSWHQLEESVATAWRGLEIHRCNLVTLQQKFGDSFLTVYLLSKKHNSRFGKRKQPPRPLAIFIIQSHFIGSSSSQTFSDPILFDLVGKVGKISAVTRKGLWCRII